MAIRGFKNKEYLDYIGRQVCVVTGGYPVDCHHESVVRKFSGQLKKHFDYGALPLEHKVHLYERHNMGKVNFWEKYDLDPVVFVLNFLEDYLDICSEEYVEEVKYVMEMIRSENEVFSRVQ